MSPESSAIPWWIFAIRGDLPAVEPLVSTSWSFLVANYAPADVAFVKGLGWTGIYGYRREPVPYEIADELIRHLKLEVVIMDLGESYGIRYHVNGSWDFTLDPQPQRFVSERGMPTPWVHEVAKRRACRQATVIPDVNLDDMAELGVAREKLVPGPRGVVALGNESRAVRHLPHTVVYRYLDDGEFVVDVFDGESLREFAIPPPTDIPALDSIAGETEPRAIVRTLGIPEEWMFAPDSN